ncbi:hypothetical protein DRO61_00295 [Candidatus Bathyarchaeota archaeon]|nr:MAG: hypothetical protein DRO61_00295 [Candidatus Bathyarchaeota archaeon]
MKKIIRFWWLRKTVFKDSKFKLHLNGHKPRLGEVFTDLTHGYIIHVGRNYFVASINGILQNEQ